MDPKTLGLYLDELAARGVTRARVKLRGGAEFEVALAPPVPDVAPGSLVDKSGKPINLDEGLPELARDDIAAANFEKDEK